MTNITRRQPPSSYRVFVAFFNIESRPVQLYEGAKFFPNFYAFFFLSVPVTFNQSNTSSSYFFKTLYGTYFIIRTLHRSGTRFIDSSSILKSLSRVFGRFIQNFSFLKNDEFRHKIQISEQCRKCQSVTTKIFREMFLMSCYSYIHTILMNLSFE